jgi:hypothetical protein
MAGVRGINPFAGEIPPFIEGNPPGLLVDVEGVVGAILFSLYNTTDNPMDVALYLTGPDVPIMTTLPFVQVPSNEFTKNYFATLYDWPPEGQTPLPAGGPYNAYVIPESSGKYYLVASGLMVLAPGVDPGNPGHRGTVLQD